MRLNRPYPFATCSFAATRVTRASTASGRYLEGRIRERERELGEGRDGAPPGEDRRRGLETPLRKSAQAATSETADDATRTTATARERERRASRNACAAVAAGSATIHPYAAAVGTTTESHAPVSFAPTASDTPSVSEYRNMSADCAAAAKKASHEKIVSARRHARIAAVDESDSTSASTRVTPPPLRRRRLCRVRDADRSSSASSLSRRIIASIAFRRSSGLAGSASKCTLDNTSLSDAASRAGAEGAGWSVRDEINEIRDERSDEIDNAASSKHDTMSATVRRLKKQ